MTATPPQADTPPLRTRLDPAAWLGPASPAKEAANPAASEQHAAYRSDVDGLRAIAVLTVVLYHAGLPLMSGGFVGVDVFFVISGFVISKSLLSDLDRGRFSISSFYERRVRRIFPALFVTLLVTWAAAFVMLLPSYFVDFSKSLAASGGFVSNLYFWKNSGYFANGANLRPLLHTWSLSVEEQYYIFAPLTFFVIYRVFQRRWLMVLAPAAAVSLALSIYATQVGPTANFFLLPTRAWELLLGAILALRPPPSLTVRWARELLSALGLGLIAWSAVAYTEATPFPGLAALPPCVGAALLIYAGSGGGSLIKRTLSLRPVVGVGLISYSLYLVHWPVVSLLTYHKLRSPSPSDVAPILAVSVALAYLSWRFVERPFRSRTFGSRRTILCGGVAMIAAVVGLGVAGVAAHGFPGRFAHLPQAHHDPQGLWREDVCFLGNNPDISRWSAQACTLTAPGQEGVLLWGDSYAAHYAPGIRALAAKIPYTVIQYTAAGCPPILSYSSYSRPNCQAFNRNALAVIARNHIKTVVISARWVDMERRGLEELQSTLQALSRLGVKTYVIGQSPMFTTDVLLIASRQPAHTGKDTWPVSFDAGLNRRLRAMAGPGGFIDPVAGFCRNGACPFRQGDDLLFADEGHYSALGSVRAVQDYFPLFARQSAERPQPSAR